MSGIGGGIRDGFTSKFGILCAAAGSAIGLGNIWRFPYIVGENGGAAFLLVYIGLVILLGIPVMLSELLIGRRGQLNAFGSFRRLAPGKKWWMVGVMGIAAAFMILAFYSTIAGWTLEYLMNAITNSFQGKSSDELGAMFQAFHTQAFRPLMWQFIFMALTAGIILGGVKKGIEKYSKILMPFLVVLLLIMVIRSLTLPGAMAGLSFLFKPDFSEIDSGVFLSALGQAFFSLSIGMGTLITYGSYINRSNNLSTIAIEVSFVDTLIASTGRGSHISCRICLWPGSCRGSGAYFPCAAKHFPANARRLFLRHHLFRAAGHCSPDLVDLHSRSGGGFSG
jgi:neurotransmitter:Na+ symporter, NSS family